MARLHLALLLPFLAALSLACGPPTDSDGTDAGGSDSGTSDGGTTDGGASDGGATDGGATDGGGSDGGGTDGGVTNPACAALQDGWNVDFLVDGEARSFVLNLPSGAETDGPWPVVFGWHGLGGSATDFSSVLSPHVNDPNFPFIAVSPEDSGLMMYGYEVDWDVFTVDAATNKEMRLFDEILACLEARYGVDEDRVHVTGFSLGGAMTNLTGVARGGQVASVAAFSGAYLSNSENTAVFGPLAGMVSWPTPSHGNAYTQLLIHGGPTDSYTLSIVTLQADVFAENDVGYLNGMGHDAILCDHGQGHSVPLYLMPATDILDFFQAHPLGTTASPYANGLPGSLGTYCTFSAGN
ncbi:MAG: hypothetical protein P1V51_21150 [Deltaproteobacteria bacterium]|nr:hypothetical protein [Deltaproteobacteria bacterium]